MEIRNNKLYYSNGLLMGDVLQDVDGDFKFWPTSARQAGYWTEGDLLGIAKILHELNIPTRASEDAYFNQQETNNE